MTIHNAVFLACKIKDLKAISARQKCKREIPRSYIANGSILTTEKR